MSNKQKIGKDSVVIGNVTANVGDRSVVIGATDNRGNTIINTPMAVGHGAQAGPGSIAIGAGAGAGSDIFHLIARLRSNPELQDNNLLLEKIDLLTEELQKGQPDNNIIRSIWSVIEVSATTGGVISLVQQIGVMLS